MQSSSKQKLTLYHQTDIQSADAILSSQKMRRGSGGAVGGGIYFATTPQNTDQKAHHKGAILSARVTIRNSLVIANPTDLANHTHTKLKASGYDSVVIKCFNGDEYVVYNWSQVTDIKLVSSTCPNLAQKYVTVVCPHGARCYRKNPEHWRDFHPPGSRRSFKKASSKNVCYYGNDCYRTNPNHIRKYHPPGFIPAPKP